MNAKMIWANFSVKDVKRTHQFYTQLGFTPNGTNNYPGLASFIFGDNNFVIHFFEEGTQISDYLSSSANAGKEIIFTLSASTEKEAADWYESVLKAGGTIFQPLERDKNNYYGFGFSDPDGHKFNILLMEKGM